MQAGRLAGLQAGTELYRLAGWQDCSQTKGGVVVGEPLVFNAYNNEHFSARGFIDDKTMQEDRQDDWYWDYLTG